MCRTLNFGCAAAQTTRAKKAARKDFMAVRGNAATSATSQRIVVTRCHSRHFRAAQWFVFDHRRERRGWRGSFLSVAMPGAVCGAVRQSMLAV
jgi:hypothetical protein